MPDEDVRELKHWLVRAKLEPPRQRLSLVSRLRLLSRLDDGLAMRLCLIVAPAGFGKTTLLAEWRERMLARDARVAWLTLDEADGDVKQFLSYLIVALSSAGVAMNRLETLAEQGLMELPVHAVLDGALEAVAAAGAPVVIVLDDYHRMDSADVDSVVCRLIDAAPENLMVVAASRSRPSLKTPQMLAAGRATEIDADALRFSLDETRGLMDPRASDRDVTAVFERTEGWAVAVQLARLAFAGDRHMDLALGRLTGHSGHFASYLTDQVLANLAPDLVDFLMQTAILERFNAPLANAVCDGMDSWAMLKRLEPLYSLLMPIDDRGEWFRYHHLFAEYLQNLLRRRCPDRLETLHGRACEWLRAQGYVSDAVRHASLASDFDRCAQIIEEAGGWELILYGGIGHLRGLLRHMPEKELYRFPRVLLARAYLSLKDGQIPDARKLVEAARAARSAEGADDRRAFERDMINVGTLTDLYEDRAFSPERLRQVRALQDGVDPSDSLTGGVLFCANALASLAVGDFDDAETRSRNAMRAMRRANSVLGLNYCFLHAGGAAFYRGRFQIAEAHYRQARQLAEDNFGADSGLRSLADVLHGALLFWRDEWNGDALADFDRALTHVENYDGWFEIYAHALDVSVAARLHLDDVAGAEAAIRRGQAIAAERGIERLELLVEGHRLACLVYEGENLQAARLSGELTERLPPGCWRRDRYLWRPYCEAGLRMAEAIALADRSQAVLALDDVIACARSLEANFYLVRALVRKATLLYEAGDRAGAIRDMIESLELATPERIKKPFREKPATAPLLRAALKHAREEALDSVILGFIGACLEPESASAGGTEALEAFGLSPREMEVLQELAHGASNKEIARALDLTEHTVKFHLKNIFAKLGVERRGQAIALARGPSDELCGQGAYSKG